MAPQNRPHPTKAFHFHRSAMAPVGIVATVSMKATMYRKKPMTAAPPAVTMALPDRAKPPCHRKTQLPLPMRASPSGALYPKSKPGST